MIKSHSLSDFELETTVGTGTFGRVRLCKYKATGEYFAMKIVKKDEVVKPKQLEHTLNEAKILSTIQHRFIVRLFQRFMDETRLYLVFEFVPGGELFSHLRKTGKLPNNVAKFYIAEVILAIEYLHSQDIVYRDLKPENLLLAADGHIKLTDFGFAKKVVDRSFTLCGTPEYLCPEMIQGRGHAKPCDWWAVGILLYEMIVGYAPYFDETPFKIYERILEGRLQFPKWVDARARDLIQSLLNPDPLRRLGSLRRGAHDIKKHRYFAGVEWETVAEGNTVPPIPIRLARGGDHRYFDFYPESGVERRETTLTEAQQELFKEFCV